MFPEMFHQTVRAARVNFNKPLFAIVGAGWVNEHVIQEPAMGRQEHGVDGASAPGVKNLRGNKIVQEYGGIGAGETDDRTVLQPKILARRCCCGGEAGGGCEVAELALEGMSAPRAALGANEWSEDSGIWLQRHFDRDAAALSVPLRGSVFLQFVLFFLQ